LNWRNLLRDTELDELQREFLEIIYGSSETLLVIINDILDFSKIEAGKMSLSLQSVNLREVVKGIINLLQKQAMEKKLRFDFKIADDLPEYILSDATRLRQILFNLLGNAIKFTEMGLVSLDVSLKKDSDIHVVNTKNNGENNDKIQDHLLDSENLIDLEQTKPIFIHFAIKDTGIGISEEGISNLFESFSQVDGSKTRNYGGTGLGLTICQSLCEMMGGRIWVESEFEQGSIFHFTIRTIPTACPVYFEPFSTSQKPSINRENFLAIAKPKSSLRILIAEDNLVNQKVARFCLQKLGYEADFAINGVEVLKILAEKKYDLIFMDIQMPEMDGLETTRRIRAQENERENEHIQIIAMTANAMPEDREACLNAGMDDYTSKPISLTALQHILESCTVVLFQTN
jgi:CheY-like chemotaxis protein